MLLFRALFPLPHSAHEREWHWFCFVFQFGFLHQLQNWGVELILQSSGFWDKMVSSRFLLQLFFTGSNGENDFVLQLWLVMVSHNFLRCMYTSFLWQHYEFNGQNKLGCGIGFICMLSNCILACYCGWTTSIKGSKLQHKPFISFWWRKTHF